MSEVRIAAEPRSEFGKGPARRTRRAGRVPAVLYGHGTDPRHVSLPGHEMMLALKSPNVLIRLEGLPGGTALALPKAVQRDPLRGFLEHVDLLLVRHGEKVTVEVPIQLSGEIVPGGLLDQQLVQIPIEADATRIPQFIEVDIAGMEVGASVHGGDLNLPSGATLAADPEVMVLHVVASPTAEQMEAEIGVEAPAAAAEAPAPVEGEPAAQAEESG